MNKIFYPGQPDFLDRLNEMAQAQIEPSQSDWNAPAGSIKAIANKPTLAAVATSGNKADVGLGNVNNTSDANKPVSAAQAAAIAAAIGALTKASVGLGNVDNTSDLNKPISNDVATALAGKQASLGYPPVQQGTGIGQTTNAVKIGWSSLGRLKATVDVTDQGNFAMENAANSYSNLQTFSAGIRSNTNGFNPLSASWITGGLTTNGAFGGGVSMIDSGLSSGGAMWTQSANIYFGVGQVGSALQNVVAISSGAVTPATDNSKTLGTASLRWNTVYAGTGTINTSDAKHKTPVRAITDAEAEWAISLAGEIGIYQFLTAVAEKGEAEARLHCGMTVQRAIELGQQAGLDPMRYAFICHDEWEDEWREVPDPAGDIVRMVEQQAQQAVLESFSEVQIIGGRPVLVSGEREVMRPVFNDVPVINAAGNPVMVATPAVLGAAGEEIEPAGQAQMTYPVAVMEQVEQRYTRKLVREAGDIYSFRTDQLALFIARGLAARLAALESS